MDAPLLCLSDGASFWPSFSWTEFHERPRKEATVVVVPVVGLADWGLGHPLDLEEVVLCSILKEASANRGALPLLVLPPLRFVTGPEAGCAFAVDPPVACALISEVVLSVKASGFTRVVLLNSSPWNEELCDAVARDLRIEHGLQMFCISMSGLGLDLHPTRSKDRWRVRALFTTITGMPAGPVTATLREGGPDAGPSENSPEAGEQTFESASRWLGSLLKEIFERPPLRDGGRLGTAHMP
jgi:creatinine amidohydrolase